MFNFSNKFETSKLIESKNVNITFLNHYSYLISRKHKEVFRKMDYVYADGKLFKIFVDKNIRTIKKISFDMSSIAKEVFDYAMKNNKTLYFAGGEKGIASKFTKIIQKEYPDLLILGSCSGYFNNTREKKDIYQEIIDLKPNIIIASMGTPYQEYFLDDLRKMGWQGVGFTSGGFFHQTVKSGINFYPGIIKKLNIRWFYRILKEPHTLLRYTLHPFLFIFFFLYDVKISKFMDKSKRS
tara:strand:- start:1041 stop:1757 length:717 start_codon:yes stop_codon:yes gene_type:complete